MARQDFSSRELEDLTIEELAYCHLNNSVTRLKSAYLHNALEILESEQLISQGNAKFNFLPVMASFAILDQLGDCYKSFQEADYPTQNSGKPPSGIKKALYYFCGMSADSEEMKALYALRCSFMHNGSLVNSSYGKHYQFYFDRDSDELVTLPKVGWDGNYSTFDSQVMMTGVSPAGLCQVARDGRKKAADLLEQNDLGILIPSEEEFYYRFFKKFELRK